MAIPKLDPKQPTMAVIVDCRMEVHFPDGSYQFKTWQQEMTWEEWMSVQNSHTEQRTEAGNETDAEA